MKGSRVFLFTIAVVFLISGPTGTAMAFHGGGVAPCEGCHTIHSSADNPLASGASANVTLLKGSDASSTCLTCHAGTGSYHIASDELSNTNAGGDFGWIKTNYTVTVDSIPVFFDGDNNGHNIIAIDFGYTEDLRSTNTQAPGGTYASSLLGCTSCHDAHGQVHGGTKGGSGPISGSGSYGAPDPTDGSILGNFRLLGDSDYEAGGLADRYPFSADAPIAITLDGASFGQDTAYGSGMFEWCANCHDYAGKRPKHVAGAVTGDMSTVGTNYSCYIKTGDWDCSQSATSYDELVPFERGAAVARTSLSVTSTAAPVAGAQVMCLTCHRAHASAHANSGRWDLNAEFIAQSSSLIATGLPGTAVVYYDSTGEIDVVARYGPYQRSLCNKCHTQD